MDDANCEHWAGLGMCQRRANLMIDKCQHACNSCPKGKSVSNLPKAKLRDSKACACSNSDLGEVIFCDVIFWDSK